MKKFDVDRGIPKEDPLFGEFRRGTIPQRLTPLDGKMYALKDILITPKI
jgi:hypothetical protein